MAGGEKGHHELDTVSVYDATSGTWMTDWPKMAKARGMARACFVPPSARDKTGKGYVLMMGGTTTSTNVGAQMGDQEHDDAPMFVQYAVGAGAEGQEGRTVTGTRVVVWDAGSARASGSLAASWHPRQPNHHLFLTQLYRRSVHRVIELDGAAPAV